MWGSLPLLNQIHRPQFLTVLLVLSFPINLLAVVTAICHSFTAGAFFEVAVRKPAAKAKMATDCEEWSEEDFGVFFGHEGFPSHDI